MQNTQISRMLGIDNRRGIWNLLSILKIQQGTQVEGIPVGFYEPFNRYLKKITIS